MVFVTLGNQNFQFKRLLILIEDLIKKKIILEDVIVQTGHTKYDSDYFTSIKFLDKEGFNKHVQSAKFVISHAGTGSIISCLKEGKKIIVAARLAKFGEHIDNHQEEILKSFSHKNYIIGLNHDLVDLETKIKTLDSIVLSRFVSNNNNFNERLIEIIDHL